MGAFADSLGTECLKGRRAGWLEATDARLAEYEASRALAQDSDVMDAIRRALREVNAGAEGGVGVEGSGGGSQGQDEAEAEGGGEVGGHEGEDLPPYSLPHDES